MEPKTGARRPHAVEADGGWLSIRVELISGRGEDFEPPPGRVLVAAPTHTLATFAGAIDLAFARWDLSHLHLFRFEDGSSYMPSGSESDDEIGDSGRARLGSLGLGPRTVFEYVFDLGDDWTHRCTVETTDLDPLTEFGERPRGPVPVSGWGSIPDQYGRVTAEG